MTIWGIAGMWLGFVAYAVGWHWGGRAERFAAGILVLHCIGTVITFKWEIWDFHLPRMILDYVRLLIFGWLCFRSNRWWLFGAVSAMAMMALLFAVAFLNAALYIAAASAFVGLGYLLDLSLIFGVCERVLAGESPARHGAWTRANAATARRARKNTLLRSAISFPAEPAKAST